MNKLIFNAVLFSLLLSCSSEDLSQIPDSQLEPSQMESFRSEKEAIQIAIRALNEFYPIKSRSVRDFSGLNVVMLQSPEARSTEYTNPLYVVNFGNESGYAIVSASKDREALLAVTESGSITSLEEIENPGLMMFVEDALSLDKDSTALVSVPEIGDGSEMVTIYRNDTVFHAQSNVEPRTTVNWGQRYPEGILCPNGICGCVATAGAQALSYFENPESLTLSFSERQSDMILLDWGGMKRMVTPSYYWGTNEIQLASLCREIGYKIGADYTSSNGTSASLFELREYFRDLLPSNQFVVSNMVSSTPKTNVDLGMG